MTSGHIGDVPYPDLIRCGRRELAVHEVLGGSGSLVALGGVHETPKIHASKALLSHHTSHALEPDMLAVHLAK